MSTVSMSLEPSLPADPAAAPIGPSVREWKAMTEAQRQDFFQRVFDALHTPIGAMSQGRPHNRARSAATDALTRHFKSTGRLIYVADELSVIYPGEPSFEPDLLAVLEVPQPDPDEDERMAWVVADEGKGPDFILEVLHKGNRDKDLVRNVTEYARLGVREYFVYDRMKFKLHGYRQGRRGSPYQALRPRLGRLTSEVLGLDLALVQKRLRFFSGMAEVMTSEEVIERISTMMEGIEARAEQAEAEAEKQQAEAERQQAEAERQRAKAEKQREERLRDAREAVFDLAEVLGIEITPERRHEVEQAELDWLRVLRQALKSSKAWR